MSTGLAAVYFVVSLIATLYAAAVFAERLDHLGARLGLPEALLGLLTAAGADAPELASAIAAIADESSGASAPAAVSRPSSASGRPSRAPSRSSRSAKTAAAYKVAISDTTKYTAARPVDIDRQYE